jgi:methionine-S-sulfoxide reductase
VRAALLAAAAALTLAAAGAARAAEPKVATFASGCFWCTESDFEKVPGVIGAVSGYTGGHDTDPTYREVSAGGTGHAESVQVRYDPDKVTYQRLLEVYWRNVDPLDAGGQFCDRGEQYRPAIFANDEEQRRLAEESKAALERSGRFGPRPIVVQVQPAGPFYPAEDYHQDYATLHPNAGYIVAFDLPKIANLKTTMPELYRDQPVLVASSRK